MISKVALENFRCFQEFTLDGIRPVTLIAGANNVGKSTMLESIFLFVGRYTADVFSRLNSFRGIQLAELSPQMVWEPLFSNMDTSKNISIIVTNNNESQAVVFSKDDSFSLSSVQEAPLPLNIPGIGTPFANSYPLKIMYKDTHNDVAHFMLSVAGISLIPQKPISGVPPHTFYISSRINFPHTLAPELFSIIEIAGNKSKCVEVLKLLDDRIKDLSVVYIGGVNGIFVDLGLKSKLSINVIGDGVNKLLHLALVMLAAPGAIILVDEIENGFHYSFFPKLWEVIGKLASETNCQVIATSHSYECINGASALAVDADLFRFVRFDRKDGVTVPHIFDNDAFSFDEHMGTVLLC